MRRKFKKSLISVFLCTAVSCVLGACAMASSFTVKADTPEYHTLDGFTIDEKASVRATSPNGIRFTTELSSETKSAIDALDLDNVSYGTLLLPADFLGTEELTHSTAKVVDIPTKSWQNAEQTMYTSVLAGKANGDGTYQNLSETYYNRPLAARSYVKGEKDGQEVVYYSENTAVRSIGYVAYMAQKDGHNSQLINDIVAKTQVKLEFTSARISANQSSESGTTVVENAIPQSTSQAAVVTIGGIPVPAEMMENSISYSVPSDGVIDVNGDTLTALKAGNTTVTANVTFDGQSLTATKEISTDGYEAATTYKILISEAAESAQLNSATNYKPAQTEDEYNAYALAFEKTAAYKVQSVLEEATGTKLPIVTAAGEKDVKYISVGKTSLATIDVSDIDPTEAKVQVDNNGNVIILGNTEEGTLYGVQRWLFDVAGYEYFMQNTYRVNDKAEIVAVTSATYTRDIDYNVTQIEKLNAEGSLDEFGMRSYTEGVIPVGTTDAQDEAGDYYRGVAHNSVMVLQANGFVQDTTTYIDDNNGKTWTGYRGWRGNTGTAYTLNTSQEYAATFANGGAATTNNYKDWYATYTHQFELKTSSLGSYSKKTAGEFYHMIANPAYDKDAPAGTFNSYQYIKAELCYTAHGNDDETYGRPAMVEATAAAMFEKMQKFGNYDRIGFALMDHSIWCECSYCKAQGNPADNLLEFLLDVAASLEAKLTAAGDGRADTFRICTLFYHKTNVVPEKTANYASKLSNMKHMEIWFAETGADLIDPITSTDSKNNWNETVYQHFQGWKSLADQPGENDATLFWWHYYQNTTSQFIPFNTINALRANYATAKEMGVETMFNQMMGFQTNWSGLKYYLMSKLTDTATPNDTTWNGWLDSYFEGAYGQGAAGMKAYFESWNTVTTNNASSYRRNASYEAGSKASTASIAVDARDWDTIFTVRVLEGWIDSIDDALAALDKADPNYENYYRNIMLEKLVPMYLLMWMHDGYTPVTDEDNLPWPYINPDVAGTFKSNNYVSQYGSEFLTWVNEWNITYDGEGTQRVLKPFLEAISGKGSVQLSKVVVSDLVVAEAGKQVTLYSAGLVADTTYTVSGDFTSATSATVSTAGQVTIAVKGDLTVGDTYNVTFTDTKGNSVTFTNVIVATQALAGNAGALEGDKVNGYYVVNKTYYVEEGEAELWLTHNLLAKGNYTVMVNGNSTESTVYYTGKLKVNVGKLPNGEQVKVDIKDSNNNIFVFNVVCAKFIRTAEELKALGVGGGLSQGTASSGNGNSYVAGKDVTGVYVLANDIDCSDVVFAAGYSGGKSYFKATLDGNGYTLWNVSVNEGGIFGGMLGATVKNMTIKNVVYADNLGNYAGNHSNYTALFAHSAVNTTFKDIEITVTKSIHNMSSLALYEGLLVAVSQDGSSFENITVNAKGLALTTVLGAGVKDTTKFSNVVIYAASYKRIGYADGESYTNGTDDKGNPNYVEKDYLTNWPTGVTFTTVTEKDASILSLSTNSGAGATLPYYVGDVTEFGFAEGTAVQYLVSSNRTTVWGEGDPLGALGVTMEEQRVHIEKAKGEDYASVLFSFSRPITTTGTSGLFYAWYLDGSSRSAGVQFNANGTCNSGPISAAAYDMAGNKVTSFEANTVYELRWYGKDVAIAFQFGCMEANGEFITIYYANPTSGNEDILQTPVTVSVSQSVTTTETNGTATATFTATGESTLDVSAVRAIVGSKPVTMKLDGKVIYEGVLSSDALTFNSSLFASVAGNNIVVSYDGGKVYLPINVSTSIELNQQNAGSVLKLQAILATNPKGQYVLTSNLDMGGNALKGVNTFNGTLDGNGYMITNTSLQFSANVDLGHAPVFIAENYGTIKNIGFELSDFGWNEGSTKRGITSVNYGTLSNVYLKASLKTALNSKHTITGEPTISSWNALGILGRENAGLVENCVVEVTDCVAIDNYTVAGLFYKNRQNCRINNSYVITNVEYIAPVWIDDGTSSNATKYASWSKVNIGSITPSNGWSSVWKITLDGIFFGDLNLYKTTSGAQISATNKPDEFSVYSGDVTTLGFAAGTQVYQAVISNGWSSRVLVTPEDTSADYVSVDFAVSDTVTRFTLWPNGGGSHGINKDGVSHAEGADERRIFIFDANGNDVTKGTWEAGQVYTMIVYLKGAERNINGFSFSTFDTGRTLYFANAICAYTSKISEVIEISNGEFTLPVGIMGTVQKVILNGTSILGSVSGNTVILNQEASQIKAANLGKDQTLFVVTDQARYVCDATVVTKVIKTADDIFDLGVGGKEGTGLKQNSGVAGNDVTGYYLVGNDIDCAGKLFAAGYSYGQSYFKGVFDGNGKTISNFTVGAGGLFGGMSSATLKNVNFTNVTMNGGVNDDGFWSNYVAVFAHVAYSCTFEDINVEIVNIKTERRNFPVQDGLMVEGNKTNSTFRNIVIDATGLTVENALGTNIGGSTNLKYENVVIYASDVTRIGYVGTEGTTVTGTDANGDGKDDATGNTLSNGKYSLEYEYLTEWPAGVTFVKTRGALQYKKGGNVPVYDGDETDLGFAAGTTVYHYTAPAATDNIWTVMGSNGVTITKSTFEDYASIQFVLGRDFSNTSASAGAFFSWMHVLPDNATSTVYAAGGWLYRNGTTGASSEAKFPANQNGFEFVVYEADGDLVTASNPLVAGTVYTLYVYCDYLVDIELCVYEINGESMDVYFANPSSGNIKSVVMEDVIDINAGEFTLPAGVEGTVQSVTFNGKGILTSAEGNTVVFNREAMPTSAADLGAGKTLIVVTDKGYYEIEATVVSQIITTAAELQELGVGGGVETTGNLRDFGGRGNSFEAGHDVIGYYLLGNDIDASGYYFAAGYFGYQSYFRGTFDGNDHTVYNVVVSEGGIFGGISGATIKNVNFVNVEYHGNGAPLPKTQTSNLSGQGYNNTTQYGQQTGLIAQYAVSSTIENINVQVAALRTTGNYGKESGVIVYKFGSGNEVRNINIDASGLTFNNVLGKDVSSANVTFTNVNIKAAGYSTAIGYSGSTLLDTWPTGITFTTVAENPNTYAIWHSDKAYVGNTEIMPFYAGDVKALGFAEGTLVQYAVQDNRTNMWAAGTNLGLTMERQVVRLTKTANDDYASIQFALSRDMTAGNLFFAWCYDAITGNGTGCTTLSVSKSTGKGSAGNITVQVYNLDGTVATNIVAGTAYEMRWYAPGDYRFQIGCCEQNGEAITMYWANPTSGNDA